MEGLCELVVKTREDVGRLVAQGNGVRRVAATQMNETSSRSHSVLAPEHSLPGSCVAGVMSR